MTVNDNAEIYLKYRNDLHRYATALVGPSHAEDVVSVVVLRSIRRRSLAGLDNPKAYLLKGVLNEARSMGRRRVPLGLADVPVYDTPNELVEVVAALGCLPVRQRAAVYLHYWEQYSMAEIAETMGVGAGTVKRYLHLARRRLAEVL